MLGKALRVVGLEEARLSFGQVERGHKSVSVPRGNVAERGVLKLLIQNGAQGAVVVSGSEQVSPSGPPLSEYGCAQRLVERRQLIARAPARKAEREYGAGAGAAEEVKAIGQMN